MRILESACERLNLPMDKLVINIDKYGNTSAASIPLALDELVRNNKIERGDIIAMVSFGAGMTWGSAILRW
jgi:3-oxoacyl-[acyl-carrier-protein] synthase-3